MSIASRGKVSKEDYVSYLQGLRDVRSHIYVENFSAEEASKRVPVVMYLVACLLKNVPFEKDIDSAAYLGAGFISDELKANHGLGFSSAMVQLRSGIYAEMVQLTLPHIIIGRSQA